MWCWKVCDVIPVAPTGPVGAADDAGWGPSSELHRSAHTAAPQPGGKPQ